MFLSYDKSLRETNPSLYFMLELIMLNHSMLNCLLHMPHGDADQSLVFYRCLAIDFHQHVNVLLN
jgi:hypothetical protein